MPNPEANTAVALVSQARDLGRHLRDALTSMGTPIVYEAAPSDLDLAALESSGARVVVVNLDADVGPWLQVLKLRGLKDDARRAGRPEMSGAELEMMNLAGPRTGLEMMTPLAQNVPTANFFSQGGYYRNGIVRDRTAEELMKALEQRMDANIKKAGSVEFAQVFDDLLQPR